MLLRRFKRQCVFIDRRVTLQNVPWEGEPLKRFEGKELTHDLLAC